jgi:Raf kinase inhibitor-like YbhB/YbcL family protein
MVNAVRKQQIASAPLALAILLMACRAGQALELTSPDFVNGAKISLAQVNNRCGGQNRSPALRWSGAPRDTRSFALTVFDPDADGGVGFWHWLVFDIPGGASVLPEGAGSGKGLPSGTVQATNGFREAGYGGACPPAGSGIHHYEFTLYALGAAKIAFRPDTNRATLSAYLKGRALATASLVGIYSR